MTPLTVVTNTLGEATTKWTLGARRDEYGACGVGQR